MNKKDLIYSAGFIDGEGCLTTGHKFAFRLTISSTDKSILEWLQSKFKGNINNQWLPKNPNHNMAWKWVLCKKSDLLTFLLAIIPYLKLKKSQAQLIINYMKTYPNRRKKNEISNREIDFLKIKELLRYLKNVHS